MAPTSSQLFALSSFLIGAYAAPAPQQVHDYATFKSDMAAFATGTPTALPFPGATGSLRGSQSLNGYDSSRPEPATGSINIPTSDFELAKGQAEDADLGLYLNFDGVENFQPIRGDTDLPTDAGPRTMEYERLNSDRYAPPGTDMGSVPNAHWPLGLSHNRHGSTASAGWARQENAQDLPSATAMAGVNMHLSPNAYRELHWHQANEWSLILNGTVRLTSSNEEGQVFQDDLQAGDVWFFPSGIPHSIQAKESGVEFLLIFDDGTFDESGTFLVSEMFERLPEEVLSKNFRTEPSSFDNIPDGQLYIFPGTPPPDNLDDQRVVSPAGDLPKNKSYSYHFSEQQPFNVPGGSVKIIDSANFPIASNFAAALVTVDPGAMREIHWHPTSDEWNYFISGQARITVFSAPSSSQTFDFIAGDVGYIPTGDAHYIENTGTEPVVFVEALLAPRFTDISVGQWLGLTPPQVVKDHLHLPDDVIANLPKVKEYIAPGAGGGYDPTRTNYTGTRL